MSDIAALVARQVGNVADEMRDYIASTVLPTHIVLDVWERKLRRAIDDISLAESADTIEALRAQLLTVTREREEARALLEKLDKALHTKRSMGGLDVHRCANCDLTDDEWEQITGWKECRNAVLSLLRGAD